MKDELIDFVLEADYCTHKFTSASVFRRNPASFLRNVFASVYGNDKLIEIFSSSLETKTVVQHDRDTM